MAQELDEPAAPLNSTGDNTAMSDDANILKLDRTEQRTPQGDRDPLKNYASFLEYQLFRIAERAEQLFVDNALGDNPDLRQRARIEFAKVLRAFAVKHEQQKPDTEQEQQ